MANEVILNEASFEREKQRSESEARDIIHDLDRLYTFPEEKKTRWVWELLQNAKDVADKDGVDIIFKLTNEKLEFTHNGIPFATKHLLALLYKTSTKSLNGEDGTTGKYGTGFVTTHILNKKLKISGIHENSLGKRSFELEIDRSVATLDEGKSLAMMQKSLADTFLNIENLTKSTPQEISFNKHTFTYVLSPESYIYAEKGLLELERNISFTLLINPKINSISIQTPTAKNKYTASPKQTSIEGIDYISSNNDNGLLYCKSEKLIFGIPVIEKNGTFRLLSIENQAVLFKEFPLIGTEKFNLPVFIQHNDFHPTEQRDGIRTKKITETEDDHTADNNRKALIEFVESYISFAKKLIEANLDCLHLLAKSGIPEHIDNYSNLSWYQSNIQKPIRDFILQQEIVKTCSGVFITIGQAKFPHNELYVSNDFYSLLSRLIPNKVPISDSIFYWGKIIAEQTEHWSDEITIDEETLLKLIPENIDISDDLSFKWLKDLYEYLDVQKLTSLGEVYPIYLNEANQFRLRDDLHIHPIIDNQFKLVAKGLGRFLDDEFLNRKLGQVSAIKSFDLSEFYNHLNKDLISELKVESATIEQIKAVFHICCLFRSDKAYRREKWFLILSQLLPEFVTEKKIVSVDYEKYWRSAELWSIKYICYLIEKSKKQTYFTATYFQENVESYFNWMNDFLSFIFTLNDDNSEVILKRSIIPNQIDEFRPYDEYIFLENDSKYFDDTIKDIYRDYITTGEPRRFIVNNLITLEEIRTKEVDILTKEIDKLFHDPNIESKVKKGGTHNEMFLQLNNWFEQFSNSNSYLPTFSSKRATLYVLALGEGFSKQIMEIQNSGKSIEDITELAKIQLSPEEMRFFENASSQLGVDKLFEKAKEMLEAKEQIERWKKIGKVAEIAFKTALELVEPTFEILNPDIGKDFVIKAHGKEYAIEIKSVDALKGNVNMSILQGITAEREKDKYALSVLTRPIDEQVVDVDYFIKTAKFVPNIGYQIGDTIDKWNQGIKKLDTQAELKVALDYKAESVYISRNIWKTGISFVDFVKILNKYFSTND